MKHPPMMVVADQMPPAGTEVMSPGFLRSTLCSSVMEESQDSLFIWGKTYFDKEKQ